MQLNDKNLAYLWDMLEAAQNISSFISNKSFKDYENDLMLKAAVERQIEVLGEAANRVSLEFQESHPEIPWSKIVGQRNVLAHEYKDIADKLVYNVALERIPELIDLLLPLVPKSIE